MLDQTGVDAHGHGANSSQTETHPSVPSAVTWPHLHREGRTIVAKESTIKTQFFLFSHALISWDMVISGNLQRTHIDQSCLSAHWEKDLWGKAGHVKTAT